MLEGGRQEDTEVEEGRPGDRQGDRQEGKRTFKTWMQIGRHG